MYAFDIYGTLFDVDNIQIFRNNQQLISEWRRKQLEYTWLTTMMGKYESFWDITKKALMYIMKKYGLSINIDEAMKAWLKLKPFDDAIEALPKIKDKKVALTNGDEWMVRELLTNSGLINYFDEIISCERVKKYKPAKEVYELVKGAIFISSNPWDIAGAHNAGLETIYLNRYGLNFEEIDIGGKIRLIKTLRELL
ncbi:haloacid dehalogenase, type II [Sulfolobus sp. A20]|uniref:haloacid dehalogenase type II n=1 Tax=Saccharolobus sp. A20 TaxID=1891280 RepID=UPI000845D24C|nr:haloacid dehalogenase type II [Sulfolobus sp. A20]TRM73697.1 haloacid dehalogenase type II [Sulfolobus sp. E5]TRM76319.1 haloacid dehalogenase type II [Sulfolobus sp. A20-N-F8]TRM84289.1 haloacid dehalogenase type II [Sulfolobus sp. A20-N-F6]TRM89628.1 haloacid dehalogenase type II [Sulfolobus sp. C3]TRM94711.1 haloacid dehalogenase type II [Sulfolobus sp. A20-N-G8]TRM99727.1 haloacid dehalogenase type II [Sulfolobus sp. F1]TRN04714.1 haloacid dehalogenase type II [Sulfolobus sp. E1]